MRWQGLRGHRSRHCHDPHLHRVLELCALKRLYLVARDERSEVWARLGAAGGAATAAAAEQVGEVDGGQVEEAGLGRGHRRGRQLLDERLRRVDECIGGRALIRLIAAATYQKSHPSVEGTFRITCTRKFLQVCSLCEHKPPSSPAVSHVASQCQFSPGTLT